MAEPSAVLYNQETNSYEEVPAEQVGSAVSSGKYTATSSSVETRSDSGLVTRPINELGAAATQGETSAAAEVAIKGAARRREERLDAVSNKALTFGEGVVDALSIGLIHGTSEIDELRREADSGSALLGQLVGTAIGLKLPGPVSWLSKSGEALGGKVARSVLGEVEGGFKGAVTRGLEEASVNAALVGATAFGHAITDSVIANKPFAAEGIMAEAGIGSVIGFGFGFAGSTFGQLAKASRSAVEASGIATKESAAALNAVQDVTRAWDDALEGHSRKMGVLRVLADDGKIPVGNLDVADTALREAEHARDALRKLDPERALGGDPKEYQHWRDAVERYQNAIDDATEKFSPSLDQRAAQHPIELGQPQQGPLRGPYDVDAAESAKGLRSPMGLELDKAMAGAGKSTWTSDLKSVSLDDIHARYQEIYGRPFERTPEVPGSVNPDEANLNRALDKDAAARAQQSTNPGVVRRPVPSSVSEAGQSPLTASGTGQDFIDGTKTLVDRQMPTIETPAGDTVVDVPAGIKGGRGRTVADRTSVDVPVDGSKTVVDSPVGAVDDTIGGAPKPVNTEGKDAVKKYLDGWMKEYDSRPRTTAGDQLQTRLTEALDNMAKAGGSRLDSVGGLELTKSLGLKEASTPLGSRLDQVWSLGQAGKFAADEARGVESPLRKGMLGMLSRYALRKGARSVAGAALGGALGGPAGAIMGMMLTSAGFAGSVASLAGKLGQQVAAAGEALLKGRRATLAVKAVMGNRPYQYSDEGPIKDPIERIQTLQRLAANPDAIRARVTKQLGDMVVTSPEIAQHLADTAVNHVQAIAASAPAIMMTPVGVPIKPSGTAMSKFFDFENSMHDLPGTLKAIAAGDASTAQLKAFQIGFPAVHAELVRGIVGKVDGLAKLEEAKLRTIEKALGVPLTRATADPTITARLQGNWTAPQTSPPARAQAFKISAPKPTPVQSSSSGRAPGNERRP